MAQQLFRYFQRQGGEEVWTPCKVQENLDAIKPTFTTVLALDTLLESDPDAETRDRIKYSGPLYFDIDAADLQDSIDSARILLTKLLDAGLTDHDIEIYVSGKKGFHLLVPTVCFMEKPDEPVVKLPAIYKEVAFKMAVPFLDFQVYTARRGRMFRTVYNQRENGWYKSSITATQLRTMTVAGYGEAASQPTGWGTTRAAFSPRFSLVYTAACQRVSAAKPKRSKPPTPEVLRRDMGIVNKVLRGDSQAGFNKIALQLGIYAREVGWSPEKLVDAAQGLVANHVSDSYRYNTPAKRQAALRSMASYVDENGYYAYSTATLRSLLGQAASPEPAANLPPPPPPTTASEGSGEDAPPQAEGASEIDTSFMAVRVCTDGIYADDDKDTRKLSNVSLSNLSVAHITNGEVSALQADIYVDGALVQRDASLPTDVFTGSASLHRELIRFGSGFWGSDMQARAVLGALHGSGAPAVVSLSHAGLDLVKLPNSPHKVLREGVLVWTGVGGAKSHAWTKDLVSFVFTADDAHQGVSDLLLAPHPSEYFDSDEKVEEMATFWRALWGSNSELSLGLTYGWMTACFYRPLAHAATSQFPLLHVVGSSGYGKTSTLRVASALHSYLVELPETTPNSSPFAFSQLVSCYASSPVLLDEYKPGRMTTERLEAFRALLRDAYNGKASLRGGGGATSKSATSWRGLNTTFMKAPIIFVAEALETETAILERSVAVTMTRPRDRNAAYQAYKYVANNKHMLSILGRGLMESVLREETPEAVAKRLGELVAEVGAELRAEDPNDSLDVARARRNINDRPLYNTAVALMGLGKLWQAASGVLGDERMKEFWPIYDKAVDEIKTNLLNSSAVAMPELIKWLMDLNDMAAKNVQMGRRDALSSVKLVDKGGHLYLSINIRSTYSDYRSWSRAGGMQMYYVNAESVSHALRSFDGYMPGLSSVDNVIMDWSALQEAGMPSWHARPQIWSGT